MKQFQSTRPIRGATNRPFRWPVKGLYFNPRAPYGARLPAPGIPGRVHTDFNPRAPYGARLLRSIPACKRVQNFNPRAPYGARLVHSAIFRPNSSISIHAPHTGRDVRTGRTRRHTRCNFNPRAPYGARRHPHFTMRPVLGFQSTRPIRGATRRHRRLPTVLGISIHAPHTGRDFTISTMIVGKFYFNPRAPYGARRSPLSRRRNCPYISIHAPHTGRDVYSRDMTLQGIVISIHAPHTGRDFSQIRSTRRHGTISIHAPHTGRDRLPVEFRNADYRFQSTRPIRGATLSNVVA